MFSEANKLLLFNKQEEKNIVECYAVHLIRTNWGFVGTMNHWNKNGRVRQWLPKKKNCFFLFPFSRVALLNKSVEVGRVDYPNRFIRKMQDLATTMSLILWLSDWNPCT